MGPILEPPSRSVASALDARTLPRGAAPATVGAMPTIEMPSLRGLRVAFAGGGTGGHIVPGRHLLAHARGELGDLLWFVTGRSVEQRSFAGLEDSLGGVAC